MIRNYYFPNPGNIPLESLSRYEISTTVILHIDFSGAGGGVGRATSILLHTLGASLVLTDIREQALNETATLCNKGFKVSFTQRLYKFVAKASFVNIFTTCLNN